MSITDKYISPQVELQSFNNKPQLKGFLYGYVAGNILSGSDVIKQHIDAIFVLLNKLKERTENTVEQTNFLDKAERSLLVIRVDVDNPINTVQLLSESFGALTNYFDNGEKLENKYKILLKKIIFNYLSIAKKIKAGPFVDFVTDFANKHKSSILIQNA